MQGVQSVILISIGRLEYAYNNTMKQKRKKEREEERQKTKNGACLNCERHFIIPYLNTVPLQIRKIHVTS
jgi:hypothetical protein